MWKNRRGRNYCIWSTIDHNTVNTVNTDSKRIFMRNSRLISKLYPYATRLSWRNLTIFYHSLGLKLLFWKYSTPLTVNQKICFSLKNGAVSVSKIKYSTIFSLIWLRQSKHIESTDLEPIWTHGLRRVTAWAQKGFWWGPLDGAVLV